MQQVSN